MTVKDVKERILFMDNCSRNLNNLQNCIKSNKDNYYAEAVDALEDEAGLNVSLDVLCFNTIQIIEKEIKRLTILMDNAIIQEQ